MLPLIIFHGIAISLLIALGIIFFCREGAAGPKTEFLD